MVNNEKLMAIKNNISGSIRLFSFYLVNGTLNISLLNEIDYWKIISDEPSVIEQIYAIFVNNLVIDEICNVSDEIATIRASQYIRQYVDDKYIPEIPFSQSEIELHL